MKYMKQLSIILAVTCIGEFLSYFIPLTIPASIYGLVLMLVLLITKVVKIESVDATGTFLVEIMPVMFIPAGVGLITAFSQLQAILLPVLVITVATTFIVMAVTGKVTDFVICHSKSTVPASESASAVAEEKKKGPEAELLGAMEEMEDARKKVGSAIRKIESEEQGKKEERPNG